MKVSDTLEPRVAKTRLHEPRLPTRSPRTVRSHSQKAPTTRAVSISKVGRLASLKPKKSKEMMGRSTRSSSITTELEVSLDPKRIPGLSSPSSPPEITQGQQLKAKDALNNDVDPSLGRTFDVDFSRYPSTLQRGSQTKPMLDQDSLCADIASCDTLFLDTGLQETATLKAARNLKGKVKKKKKSEGGNHQLETGTEEGSKLIPLDAEALDDNEDKNLNEATDEGKIKKKIKIVIGKKMKKGKKKQQQPPLPPMPIPNEDE